MKQIFPDLCALVERRILRMEGVCQPVDVSQLAKHVSTTRLRIGFATLGVRSTLQYTTISKGNMPSETGNPAQQRLTISSRLMGVSLRIVRSVGIYLMNR
ncbi:uncharacterized protein BDW43DRAFT_294797 [Aspergillus alliaceus]|uniref:uncharacterized protein n=1 Tax=Petromyces alliaceus TaxID=209559 RepID=UPI0012A5C468|nr:uncharacterized protein BDW43DRAFT_294797 [Aspergillus alliaceus]KAB8227177.1 hypothetical protein BDW43DRAFT_294797 [Aspergillus alliaceus]